MTNPKILLSRALMSDRLFDYLLLILPIVIGLHWRKTLTIIPALPMLGLNILADSSHQRDLIHQYSLPIIPFLFVWLIASLTYLTKHRQRSWLDRRLLAGSALINSLVCGCLDCTGKIRLFLDSLCCQALSLASAVMPLWYLGCATGLSRSQSQTVAIAYLLYPAIFNINLFDFHPEVIAVPAIFGAILPVKLDRLGWFLSAIILILSCKAVLALTVVGMGLWLVISSKYRYTYGIDDGGGVLTTSDIAPHLTHRQLLELTTTDLRPEELDKFANVLLNLRHPGWGSSPEIAEALFAKLKQESAFQLRFQQDDVFLFTRVTRNQ